MDNGLHTYNAIIVDDNEIDRLNTFMHARKYPFLNIIGRFDNATEATSFLEENKVDVLLLDIDMPEMSGLEFRRKIAHTQACIFITSYPDYALESFDLAALDFLVKPIQKDRFDMAMNRLHDYLDIVHKATLFECSLGGDAIFIKDGHNQIKVQLHDILYLEALKDYTRIVTPQKKYCVLSVLGNLLQEAAFKTFVRIHRSYAVQKHFISKVTSQQVYLNSIALPVGRTYKDSLNDLIKNI
ncbi:MAG: response regulator transcription factor [Sphingobacteriales bacterium]|nr:MAG: response regulator transcription factor [Sphingobacteriales bacterium]